MSGLTDQDARALTYLARRLRDETHGAGQWDHAGTYAIIKGWLGQSLDTCIERVRHAADREARTPAAMNRPFQPPAIKPEVRFPAKAGEDCRKHKGEHPDACRMCASERLRPAPDEPPTGEGLVLLAEIRKRREASDRPKGDPA